ncbi:ileal sodium/bile acid cotransporter [Ixodes scapularis]
MKGAPQGTVTLSSQFSHEDVRAYGAGPSPLRMRFELNPSVLEGFQDSRLREAGAEVVYCLTRGAPKGPTLPRARLNHQDALFPGHGKATHSQTWAGEPAWLGWGSSVGGLIIVASQIMEVFIFPDLFSGIPPELYGATLLMPLTGMVAGYGASWVCRRPEAVRRTVAIESGIQNVGTALTIVSLSFQFEDQKKALVFPWLYAFSMSFLSFLICVTYHFYKKHCSRSKSHDLTNSCNTVQSVVDKKENEKAQLGDHRIIGHGVFNPTFQN